MRKLGLLALLLLLVAAALAEPAERSWLGWRRPSPAPPPPSSLVLDGDLVDRIWSICLQDMVGAEGMLGFGQSFAARNELSGCSTEDELKTLLLMEHLAVLPHEKQFVAHDCICSNYFSLGISQEYGFAVSDYLENPRRSLLGSDLYPRRHLADRMVRDAPSVAPAFVPAMTFGSEAQFPLSVTEPPFTPSNSLNTEPPARHLHDKPSQKNRGVPPPISPSEKQHNYMKLVLTAVLPTTAFSFVAAFLVFYCCGCNKSKVSVGEQRDDHPLLHLQLSNASGLSPNVHVCASSLHKDDQGRRPAKVGGGSMSRCFPCCFSTSTDATTPAKVTEGTHESIATNDAPKSMPPPPPPPPPPPMPPATRKAAPPPPAPPKGSFARLRQPSPVESSHSEGSSTGEPGSESSEPEVSAPRAKLRPFYWDKVLANPNQSMAWHDIKFGSFHVNEDMIEALFGYGASNRSNAKDKEFAMAEPSPQHVSLLDFKKSCNLAVVFKAMNVRVHDIEDALIEGNELPRLLLETILRMKPTDEEEEKLRLYDGEFSQLGLAEQVMKALINIPFAFKRISALLLMSSLQEDASSLRDAFLQLEAACGELKHRLFLKLLEAVLKTGNRLNDGTFRGGANAFKLDTLLKLSDVKGADGKTTLLHFVVQEIIRSEGVREARLAMESGRTPAPSTSGDNPNGSIQEDGDYHCSLGLKIVSGLSNELVNAKKIAAVDADALSAGVSNLRRDFLRAKEFLNSDMETIEERSGFYRSLARFIEQAENETSFLLKEEKRLKSLVKKTIRYFHGNDAKDNGFGLFVTVRDFLVMLDRACKQVEASQKKAGNKSQSIGSCSPASQSIPQDQHFVEKNHQEQQHPAVLDHHLDSSDSND